MKSNFSPIKYTVLLLRVNERYSSGLLVVIGLGVANSVLVPAECGTGLNDMDILLSPGKIGAFMTVPAIPRISLLVDKSHGDWAERILEAHSASPFLQVLPSRS